MRYSRQKIVFMLFAAAALMAISACTGDEGKLAHRVRPDL